MFITFEIFKNMVISESKISLLKILKDELWNSHWNVGMITIVSSYWEVIPQLNETNKTDKTTALLIVQNMNVYQM